MEASKSLGAAMYMFLALATPAIAQDVAENRTGTRQDQEATPQVLLRSLVGSWEGTCRTWFQPDKLADESKVKGEFTLILGGRFLRHTYEGKLPTMTRFEIVHPFGGLSILAGFYYLTFFPGLLPITGDDPCWYITIEMIGEPSALAPEGLVVRRNSLMCMNSCIMPHIGFAALSGLVLGTDFVLYNVNPVTNSIRVQFYDQDGTPAQITIGNTTSSVHSFSLAPNTSLRVRPSVSDPSVKVVWSRQPPNWRHQL